jgi:hypothetical protein
MKYGHLRYTHWDFVFISAFLEEDDSESQSAIESDFLSAEWIQELPEDLDMCIAQRDFEGAVDLVERGQ